MSGNPTSVSVLSSWFHVPYSIRSNQWPFPWVLSSWLSEWIISPLFSGDVHSKSILPNAVSYPSSININTPILSTVSDSLRQIKQRLFPIPTVWDRWYVSCHLVGRCGKRLWSRSVHSTKTLWCRWRRPVVISDHRSCLPFTGDNWGTL